jgi:hypothetical protein
VRHFELDSRVKSMSDRQIHLGTRLDSATLDSLAEFICGDDRDRFPTYHSSSFLNRFFQSLGINETHDGSTRKYWVLGILEQLSPTDIEKVILRLTDLREYKGKKDELALAFKSMNDILAMDNFGVGIDGARPILIRGERLTIDEDELSKSSKPSANEQEFLKKKFDDHLVVADLHLDPSITPYLQDRIDEVQACPKDEVALGTIFLLGSTLEGLLLAVALLDQPKFMKANAAPKDKLGNVLKIYDWKLVSLIDVAHEVGILDVDVKKFSHALRDFRNYIHPYEQMSQAFRPTDNTVVICWHVFKAAFEQLQAYLVPGA